MRPALLVAAWVLCLASAVAAPAAHGAAASAPQAASPSAVRLVELTAPDGTPLKASYFSAARSGPGVLLLHQVNRERKSWDALAAQLAAAGIHTLTLDMRGHGASGGPPYEQLPRAQAAKEWSGWPGDIEVAFQYLVAQPGVAREAIGLGGAGVLGVDNAVRLAKAHAAVVKSLVLLSGETFGEGLQFLHQASQLPVLFVVADDDEYPPTVEAMELLYITSTNPGRKLIHYSRSHDAPWLWYEPFDIGRVPTSGSHGTDLFETHAELQGMIVDWLTTTLIRTPGRAPADTLAAAPILTQLQTPGGAARVTVLLTAARRTDPETQLFPEITASIIGADYQRAGDVKSAIEVFELVLLAYPQSADAHGNLADAYLADGQKEPARQHAERALALLDAHAVPASSWSDSEPYRGEIRRGAQKVLAKLDGL
jgi:tetratricopeptide (TPR) repeat protein